MMLVALFLGCIMDGGSIMMISIPIFVAIVKAVGFDIMWFTVVLLVGAETGMITPPFGLNLFAIKVFGLRTQWGRSIGCPFLLPFVASFCLVSFMFFPSL